METNKIPSIKIQSFKVETKQQMAIYIARMLCILQGITLSELELQILAHFMCEGYNKITREQLVEGKLRSKNSIANTISSFRKKGIIVKDKFMDVLSPNFRVPIEEKVNINITFDNS